MIKLNYFKISNFWLIKNWIKFIKLKNLILYLLNPNKIYKIQGIKVLFILFIKFILLYSQRNIYYFKY